MSYEKIRAEADWYVLRCERLRAILDRHWYTSEYTDRLEYAEGWAHALNWALQQLKDQA